MNASRASVAGLARLNFLLGELYSDAVLATERQFRVKADLVGCHGANPLSPRRAGAFSRPQNRSHVADRRSCDHRGQSRRRLCFRFPPRRHGGRRQGRAPGSVSRLHAFPRFACRKNRAKHRRHRKSSPAIPAGATPRELVAFDTGPGNDGDRCCHRQAIPPAVRSRSRIAASGKVLEKVIHQMLHRDFFRKAPPKTAGRRRNSAESSVRRFLRSCGRCRKQDAVATAHSTNGKGDRRGDSALYHQKLRTKAPLSGDDSFRGGAKNSTLVTMFDRRARPIGLQLRFSDEFGPALGGERSCGVRHPGARNLASARLQRAFGQRGAKRSAVLGKNLVSLNSRLSNLCRFT